ALFPLLRTTPARADNGATTTTFPLTFPPDNIATNACGESVLVTDGEVHQVFHVFFDAAGRSHLLIQTHCHGSGTGTESGAGYIINCTDTDTVVENCT